MPGLFVTFEGGEGSGKTTVLHRLAVRLRALGVEPLLAREPGGTPLAEGVRVLLLTPELSPGAVSEALLMEAARSDLVRAVLRPALQAGRVVLCDRYADSTLAYQGGGRGLDSALLATLNAAATGGLEPDLTLLFDLPCEVGLARRAGAPGETNRLDREDVAFHTRVRAAYHALAAAAPARWVMLDATASPETLESLAWQAIAPRLPKHP